MSNANKPPDCFGIDVPPPDDFEPPSKPPEIGQTVISEEDFMDFVGAGQAAQEAADEEVENAKKKKNKKLDESGPDGYLKAVYGK